MSDYMGTLGSWTPSNPQSLSSGIGHPFPHPPGDQTTLELRSHGEVGEQRPAGGPRRVKVLREAGESDPLVAPSFKLPHHDEVDPPPPDVLPEASQAVRAAMCASGARSAYSVVSWRGPPHGDAWGRAGPQDPSEVDPPPMRLLARSITTIDGTGTVRKNETSTSPRGGGGGSGGGGLRRPGAWPGRGVWGPAPPRGRTRAPGRPPPARQEWPPTGGGCRTTPDSPSTAPRTSQTGPGRDRSTRRGST